MCGIAGIVLRGVPEEDLRAAIGRMNDSLAHRGPDATGYYVDARIALGVRRLSIIDLSPRGNQPMANEDGTAHLAFNGEIYNYRALRADLAARGHRFRSHADSEVILHLYEEQGARCVDPLRGMFAFALWDARRDRLLLARDRLGEKPLCYAETPQGFVFGSEPVALFRSGLVRPRPSMQGLRAYLTWGYLPPPASAFEGVAHLPPAHMLTYDSDGIRLSRYWTPDDPPGGDDAPSPGPRSGGWDPGTMPALVEEAVRLRLVSDVPVGAFLSGGIDSSTVVALMMRHAAEPVKTFAIGFEAHEYDELPYARAVAAHLGTDHHEFVVRPDVVRDIPDLVRAYGEPMLDPSGLATLYLARAARAHLKVVLTGDGGDEVFGGYARYAAARWSDMAARTPEWSRRLGRAVVAAAVPFGRRFSAAARVLECSLERDPVRRYAKWLYACDPTGIGAWLLPEVLAAGDPIHDLGAAVNGDWTWPESPMRLDLMTYLPGDILRKADTTTMACGLEARAPLLDHHLVAAMARAGPRARPGLRDAKPVLRAIGAGLLPPAIVRRPKHGFTLPLRDWLRGPLRRMAEEVVLDGFRRRGYGRPDRIEQIVREHLAGRRAWHTVIWTLLMLELWHRAYVDAGALV